MEVEQPLLCNVIDIPPPIRFERNIFLSHLDPSSDANDCIIISRISFQTLHVVAKKKLQKIILFPSAICDATIYTHSSCHHCIIVCLLENGDLYRISLRDKKKKKREKLMRNGNGSMKHQMNIEEEPMTKKKKISQSSSQLSLFDEENMALDEEHLHSTLVENFTTTESLDYLNEGDVNVIDVSKKRDRYFITQIEGKCFCISLLSTKEMSVRESNNIEESMSLIVAKTGGALDLVNGIDQISNKKKLKSKAKTIPLKIDIESFITCLQGIYLII